MTYLHHVTLTTGHTRRSYREEVDDGVVEMLRPWIAEAITAEGTIPMPGQFGSHYMAAVAELDGGLICTVWGSQPIATFAVATRSRNSEDLWSRMVSQFGAVRGLDRPGAPWCGVALRAGALFGGEPALEWLGDFERCVAWAWIERNKRCMRCGYPAGADWMDEGDTCPRCKLVQ